MINNKDIVSGPSNLIIVQSRAIVFNSNNELLLVSRDNKRWSTPGGTVNKHEDLDQNVIKYKKFFTEAEFKAMAKEKKLVQDELLNFSFQDITQLKSAKFFI